jgi:hypothetical protein
LKHHNASITKKKVNKKKTHTHTRNKKKMATIRVYVSGSEPQYLPISMDGKEHICSYTFDGKEHELKLQADQVVSGPFPSSSSSSSISSALSNTTLGYSSTSSIVVPSESTRPKKRHRSAKGVTRAIHSHPLSVTVRYIKPFHAEKRLSERGARAHHRRVVNQITMALERAEGVRHALELDEKSDMDDLAAVALEVKTLTLELRKRRAVEVLQHTVNVTGLRDPNRTATDSTRKPPR